MRTTGDEARGAVTLALGLALCGCWRGGDLGSAGAGNDTGTDGDTDADGDGDGDGDTDADGDGDTDAAIVPETDSWDEEDGGVAFPMGECAGGAGLLDHFTDLCWQGQPGEETFVWSEGKSHCEGLALGGLHEWRLPSIMELVSLLRGCVAGEATGDLDRSACPITSSAADCPYDDCMLDEECHVCPSLEGPGEGGCYWDPGLGGTCAETWSTSPSQLLPSYKWILDFSTARPARLFNFGDEARVRCVHDLP